MPRRQIIRKPELAIERRNRIIAAAKTLGWKVSIQSVVRGDFMFADNPVDVFDVECWLMNDGAPLEVDSDAFTGLNFVTWQALAHYVHVAVADQIVFAVQGTFPGLTLNSEAIRLTAREVAYDAFAFRLGRDAYVHAVDSVVTSAREVRHRTMTHSIFCAIRHAAFRGRRQDSTFNRLARLRVRGALRGLIHGQETSMLEGHQEAIQPIRNDLIELERKIADAPGLIAESTGLIKEKTVSGSTLVRFFQEVFCVAMMQGPNEFGNSARSSSVPTGHATSYVANAIPVDSRRSATVH